MQLIPYVIGPEPARYNEQSTLAAERETFSLANETNDKLYQSVNLGSGTFIITKPKRKKAKQRQSRLKNLTRGSRK